MVYHLTVGYSVHEDGNFMQFAIVPASPVVGSGLSQTFPGTGYQWFISCLWCVCFTDQLTTEQCSKPTMSLHRTDWLIGIPWDSHHGWWESPYNHQPGCSPRFPELNRKAKCRPLPKQLRDSRPWRHIPQIMSRGHYNQIDKKLRLKLADGNQQVSVGIWRTGNSSWCCKQWSKSGSTVLSLWVPNGTPVTRSQLRCQVTQLLKSHMGRLERSWSWMEAEPAEPGAALRSRLWEDAIRQDANHALRLRTWPERWKHEMNVGDLYSRDMEKYVP